MLKAIISKNSEYGPATRFELRADDSASSCESAQLKSIMKKQVESEPENCQTPGTTGCLLFTFKRLNFAQIPGASRFLIISIRNKSQIPDRSPPAVQP